MPLPRLQIPRPLRAAAALAALLSSGTRPLGAQVATTSPPPIAQDEYAARRAKLAAQLPADGVLLALGGHEPAEDFISFWQASPFVYLTGFQEPEGALVISRKGGATTATMFVLPRDPSREVWTGTRLGAAGVTRLTSVAARDRDALPAVLDSIARGTSTLMVLGVTDAAAASGDDGPAAMSANDQLVAALRAHHPGLRIVDADPLVQRLRGTKSAAELALIRRAVDVTVEAQRAAMGLVAPARNEYEVQALIEYTFRRNGADRPSFSTIVGSGPNSTTLHYNADDRQMNAGEVVVMDIGASFHGYAADVTRTVPVSGTFTSDQRAVYQLVRDAQAAAEKQAVLGAKARLMSDSATATLERGLARLGLIEAPGATYDCAGDGSRQCPQYRLYYMHGLGHGIGLDVHDPEQFYFTGTIGAGSAFTIEPGVYVRAGLLDILPKTARNAQLAARIGPTVKRFADVGVRIEDDYVATERGVEWISRAPREAAEVEAAMRRPASASAGAVPGGPGR